MSEIKFLSPRARLFLNPRVDYFGKIDGERRNQYNKKDNKTNKYNIIIVVPDRGTW